MEKQSSRRSIEGAFTEDSNSIQTIQRHQLDTAVSAWRNRDTNTWALNDSEHALPFIMDAMHLPKNLPSEFKKKVEDEISTLLDVAELAETEDDWRDALDDTWDEIEKWKQRGA